MVERGHGYVVNTASIAGIWAYSVGLQRPTSRRSSRPTATPRRSPARCGRWASACRCSARDSCTPTSARRRASSGVPDELAGLVDPLPTRDGCRVAVDAEAVGPMVCDAVEAERFTIFTNANDAERFSSWRTDIDRVAGRRERRRADAATDRLMGLGSSGPPDVRQAPARRPLCRRRRAVDAAHRGAAAPGVPLPQRADPDPSRAHGAHRRRAPTSNAGSGTHRCGCRSAACSRAAPISGRSSACGCACRPRRPRRACARCSTSTPAKPRPEGSPRRLRDAVIPSAVLRRTALAMLAAVLREEPDAPLPGDAGGWGAFLDLAAEHALLPAVYVALRPSGRVDVPAPGGAGAGARGAGRAGGARGGAPAGLRPQRRPGGPAVRRRRRAPARLRRREGAGGAAEGPALVAGGHVARSRRAHHGRPRRARRGGPGRAGLRPVARRGLRGAPRPHRRARRPPPADAPARRRDHGAAHRAARLALACARARARRARARHVPADARRHPAPGRRRRLVRAPGRARAAPGGDLHLAGPPAPPRSTTTRHVLDAKDLAAARERFERSGVAHVFDAHLDAARRLFGAAAPSDHALRRASAHTRLAEVGVAAPALAAGWTYAVRVRGRSAPSGWPRNSAPAKARNGCGAPGRAHAGRRVAVRVRRRGR